MNTFTIDWSDGAYPRIIAWDGEDARSFSQCRRELIDYWAYQRRHAIAMLRDARLLRRSDFEDEPA